ncbi:DUF2961 domain-containing protein [Zongyangia hominis]|uniref:DUF2961 domain-containing protein n=1 Tax=Zongyangia hominis TaxID=2763677 RepID=A0A926ECJ2_9FIRM|nr:DUF2961 domain-containing protein [Zongyangia hominis]MBC8571402.1 DUF2961 domain-containing protein [Zongyangia hominis]
MSDSTGGDFIYEAKVKLTGNSGAASLVFRSGNDPKGDGSYVANVDLGRGTARIFSFGEGGHDIGEYTLPDKSKREFALRVEAIGSSLKMYVDGVLAVNATDSAYTSGKFGLLTFSCDVLYQGVNFTPVDEASIPKLTGLTLVGAEDALSFDAAADTYTCRVDFSMTRVKIKAVAEDGVAMKVSAANETGQVLGEIDLASGEESPDIVIGQGYTTITLKLINPDKGIEMYKFIKVRRARGLAGDVNGDKQVNADDIALMRDFIFERAVPESWQLVNGDLDGDGAITVADILKVKMLMSGSGEVTEKLSYADVVSRMTDLESLAAPARAGEKCWESSAYNKKSKYNETTGHYENWGQNGDEGYDAPRSEDGGYIIAEMEGPGSIVRIWSANPQQGHIKIFIDGDPTPAVDMPFSQLFGSGEFPFNQSELCYDAARGKNCYVPITYNESCKVVLYEGWGMFYQVNYVSYPEDTQVEPFEMPLTSQQQNAIKAVNSVFAGDMSTSPKSYENGNSVTTTVTVPAGGSVNIFDAIGSGAITGMQVKINDLDMEIGEDGVAKDWKSLSDMTISAKWDGESNPSVWTTLGGFFSSITGLNEYESFPMGVLDDGTMYSNWYMPFESGAQLTIGNDGDEDYSITYTVNAAPLDAAKAKDLMRFHAKWVRAEDPPKNGNEMWPDSQFLSITGTGRFVGTSLHIYKAIGTGDPTYEPNWWWGEGDEKFFVDGEKFPSWFGTGCEDYFGYAWGTWKPFTQAYHSQPFTNGGMFGIGSRLNNRFHVIDSIPFQESFNAYLEKYHRDEYANWVFTNFFYLDKNGNDPYGPISLADRTSYYEDPYPAASDFYEGEDLKIIESTGMLQAETQNMSGYGNQWSNNAQFVFKSNNVGDYTKFYINVAEEGDYKLSAAFTKAPDFGIAQHYIDGTAIGGQIDLYGNGVSRTPETELGTTHLTRGLHVFEVRIAGKNGASANRLYGLDYLKVEKSGPDTLVKVTYEGESLEVTAQTEGIKIENQSGDKFSAGAQKLMFGSKAGDSMTLKVNVPKEGDYIISGTMTRANDFGFAQHSMDGVKLGNPIDYYEGNLMVTPDTILGKIHLTAGDHALKIEMVDKTPASNGWLYALDTLTLQQYIPEKSETEWTYEGEEMEVTAHPDGITPFAQYIFWTDSSAWSQRSHLVTKFTEANQSITLSLDVPKDGAYDISAAMSKAADFGIFQYAIDGKDIGSTVDLYDANLVNTGLVKLGSMDLKAGKHQLTITCKDKNEAAVGYLFGLDLVKLIRTGDAATLPTEVFYEGENLEIVDSDKTEMFLLQDMDDRWSGNKHNLFKASEFGGYMTLKLPVPVEGDYIVSVGMTRAGDFGIVQHAIDGVDFGNLVNLNEGNCVPSGETFLGRIHLTAGDHQFKATVVDSLNAGKVYALDYIRLTPYTPEANPTSIRVEGEDLKVTGKSDGMIPWNQRFFWFDGSAWSQNSHLVVIRGQQDSFIETQITLPAGSYDFSAALSKAADFGQIEILVDGNSVGTQDLYDPDLKPTGEISLGTVTGGEHTIKFVIKGKNASSRDYVFGIDYLQFVKK